MGRGGGGGSEGSFAEALSFVFETRLILKKIWTSRKQETINKKIFLQVNLRKIFAARKSDARCLLIFKEV